MIQTEIEIQPHPGTLMSSLRSGEWPNILWATLPQRMIQMVSEFGEFTCCFFKHTQ